jgi:sec-independent protein translocase protein TatB
MTNRVRRMAGEFRQQFDDAMREAELDEAKKAFKDMNDAAQSVRPAFNPLDTLRNEIQSVKEEIRPAATAAGTAALAGTAGSASVDSAGASGAASPAATLADATSSAPVAPAAEPVVMPPPPPPVAITPEQIAGQAGLMPAASSPTEEQPPVPQGKPRKVNGAAADHTA